MTRPYLQRQSPRTNCQRVILIPCSNRKATPPEGAATLPAGELYAAGSYHRAARRAADALAEVTGARILVVSALHGLVQLHQPLAPYDLKAGQPGTIGADELRRQAQELGIEAAEVTVLAGKAYIALARQVWPGAAAPLEGTRGIGEQLAKFAAIYRSALAPAPQKQTLDRARLSRELREHAEACAAKREARAQRARDRFVTVSPMHLHGGHTTARLTFARAEGRGAARASAAQRFAERYDVRTQLDIPPRGAIVLTLTGSTPNVARAASALPRIIYAVEALMKVIVLHYGRWTRHSVAAPHLAGLSDGQFRSHGRTFRADAYGAAVDTLLGPADVDYPGLVSSRPCWEMGREVAQQYASYGWFDTAAQADDADVERLLATAERTPVPPTGTGPQLALFDCTDLISHRRGYQAPESGLVAA
ncbi:DUF6884 domain-containing protein [Streptomyces sp. G-5]|uniref:DUF6884 domain-containing protein n=1 Tax=Streptomyces sp. G-5 TaxID=2977231 RepID=UPI0021D0B73F|nr:DUF6884 domain-containing protein [Streptomyces sp. G-5]MCU4750276.1 hypothetical protein [Streptomyces sp. G-5]